MKIPSAKVWRKMAKEFRKPRIMRPWKNRGGMMGDFDPEYEYRFTIFADDYDEDEDDFNDRPQGWDE